jgi:hypothetical protein
MQLKHSLRTTWLAFLLASCGTLANCAQQADSTSRPARDWNKHPAVVQVNTAKGSKIYAIGDAHADHVRLLGVLKAAGLIDPQTLTNVEPANVKWAAGNSVLVVTGDMINKGPSPDGSSLRVIAILRALQESAKVSGGQVIILLGNHEALFLADWKDKTDFRKELDDKGFAARDVANCKGDLGEFLCGLPIAARVNDWFFSHAGNTNGKNIAELSVIAQEAFASFQSLLTFASDKESIVDARLNGQGCDGRAWFYDCGRQKDPEVVLRRNAEALGVHHIVQGHQPGDVKFPNKVTREAGQIFQKYNGLLFLIDSGMSEGAGNYSSGGALLITETGTLTNPSVPYQMAHVICAKGSGSPLWDGFRRQESGFHLCP